MGGFRRLSAASSSACRGPKMPLSVRSVGNGAGAAVVDSERGRAGVDS
jgi:hypothetical protein